MTAEEVARVVRDSVVSGSATPTLREPRESYSREEEARLLASLIEPVEAFVVGETFRYGVLDDMKGEKVLAVARNGSHWLLYRPAKQEFSLAFGETVTSLTILGFSSRDALAEWLG